MSALVNGMLVGEPTKVLFSGAQIFHPDFLTKEAWIVLPLSDYFKQDPDEGWKQAGVALIEARRAGHTSNSMGHPSSLIGEVRRWLRDNFELYGLLKQGEQTVLLVIRPGTEQLMQQNLNAESGVSEYVPVNRWSIKVMPK